MQNLHQDFLQWTLERGWLGSLVLVLGIALVAWLWRRRWHDLEPSQRQLCWAALGGLVFLLIHGSFDLILQAPALVLQAVLFAGIIAGAMVRQRQSRSTAPLRLQLGCGALLLAAAAWWVAPLISELGMVRRVERLISQRQAANLAYLSHPLVKEVLRMQQPAASWPVCKPAWPLSACAPTVPMRNRQYG